MALVSFAGDIISIHAPTRGATYKGCAGSHDRNDFNPRPHKGSDVFKWFGLQSTSDFNPRPHKGSDLYVFSIPAPDTIFQSTPPQGERHKLRSLASYTKIISIHAPTRGATGLLYAGILIAVNISIHAPTRGATSILCLFLLT